MKLIINFPVYFVMFCINALKISLYLQRIQTKFSLKGKTCHAKMDKL